MPLNVVRGSTRKPAAVGLLVEALTSGDDLDGELFTGFPILPAQSDPGFADALLVSPTFGLVVFDVVEGSELGEFESRQDELDRVLRSRLLQHSQLVQKRLLLPEITVVTFAPGANTESVPLDEGYYLSNADSIVSTVAGLTPRVGQAAIYEAVLSVIENLSALDKVRTPRAADKPDSRGARLAALEKSIATLDKHQSEAVLATIDGVQRIRGLAGSGKTIVLALKAAYLHARHPNWNIAVTFNTRSLNEQFKRLITAFTIEQSGTEPDWDRLRVVNAWGSPGSGDRAGIYSIYCEAAGVPYYNFQQASAYATAAGAFHWACRQALKDSTGKTDTNAFDVILVDEAQDLPPEFLRMCYSMLGAKRRLVYAYDELQSLDGRGLPTPEEIFGTDASGRPNVAFGIESASGPTQDIILQKCYRNSRPVLVTAHAIGFGIYRRPPAGRRSGLVQLFESASLWSDIGYEVHQGHLRENEDVVLGRSAESSPRFLEEHSDLEDLVTFIKFDSAAAQNAWVTEQVKKNLTDEELRYDDIVIVNPNGITARKNLAPLRASMLEAGIANHLAGVDTSADVFFDRDRESLTFTGIHRAKGNEAGMVYVVNAQEGLDATANQSSVRNRLFTAITRSKAWVRVLGHGPAMDDLVAEFESVKSRDFTLQFRYPSDAERETINLVHREVTPAQEKDIKRQRQLAGQLLAVLEEHRVYAEDLDPEVRERLRQILGQSDV